MLQSKPTMGWNSWNTFGENINEQLIIETADAMVKYGFKDAGYEYVVIDDCWMLKERDEKGNLVPDPEKFPHGMKYLADYIHSKGLKFGIYSAAGFKTCMGYPGSADPRNTYLTMSMALKSTGRDILYSICTVGQYDPWKWARSIGGNMYRSHCDIIDNFNSITSNVITQIQKQTLSCTGSNCYNDFDMLTVGMYNKGHVATMDGCNDQEYKTHFALWCFFGAPLIMGADIRNLNDFCINLLTDKDFIALDQDEETRNPYYEEKMKYANYEKMSFLRILSHNKFAIAFFNFTNEDGIVLQSLADIGIPANANKKLKLKDLFTKETLIMNQDFFSPMVEKHGCKIYVGEMIDV